MKIYLYVIIILFFISCSSNEKSEEETYPVINPIIQDVSYSNEYTANIQSIQNVELRSRVKGFLETIEIDEGKPVVAGQVLFTLANQEFKEEVFKAKAAFKNALAEARSVSIELSNTKNLYEKKIIAFTEVEVAKAKAEAIQAKVDQAQSAVTSAELNLSFTQIKAPFNGVVNRIPYKQGSLIDEGTLLTTISNNTYVFAYFNMSEIEFLEFTSQKGIPADKEVSLKLANNKILSQKGTIETVGSEIDKETGNLMLRAKFSNPDELLKHGASGKVILTTALKNKILIPQKSTFEIQDKIYTYVVSSDSTVKQRDITVKFSLPHFYIVESGLVESDIIVYEGIQHVREGQKINSSMTKISQTPIPSAE